MLAEPHPLYLSPLWNIRGLYEELMGLKSWRALQITSWPCPGVRGTNDASCHTCVINIRCDFKTVCRLKCKNESRVSVSLQRFYERAQVHLTPRCSKCHRLEFTFCKIVKTFPPFFFNWFSHLRKIYFLFYINAIFDNHDVLITNFEPHTVCATLYILW